MAEMATPPISSVGVIVYRLLKGENVLIQYLLLKKTGDIWEPPKGRIDPGEQAFDAAMRETLEEANLSADQLQLEHDFAPVLVNYKRENRQVVKTAKLWLAQTDEKSQVRISFEHEDFRWCDLAEVLKIIRPGMDKGLLKADVFIKQQSVNR